jgi:hypothetical protein
MKIRSLSNGSRPFCCRGQSNFCCSAQWFTAKAQVFFFSLSPSLRSRWLARLLGLEQQTFSLEFLRFPEVSSKNGVPVLSEEQTYFARQPSKVSVVETWLLVLWIHCRIDMCWSTTYIYMYILLQFCQIFLGTTYQKGEKDVINVI